MVSLPKLNPVRVPSNLSRSLAAMAGIKTGRLQTLSATQFSTAPEQQPQRDQRDVKIWKKRTGDNDTLHRRLGEVHTSIIISAAAPIRFAGIVSQKRGWLGETAHP